MSSSLLFFCGISLLFSLPPFVVAVGVKIFLGEAKGSWAFFPLGFVHTSSSIWY